MDNNTFAIGSYAFYVHSTVERLRWGLRDASLLRKTWRQVCSSTVGVSVSSTVDLISSVRSRRVLPMHLDVLRHSLTKALWHTMHHLRRQACESMTAEWKNALERVHTLLLGERRLLHLCVQLLLLSKNGSLVCLHMVEIGLRMGMMMDSVYVWLPR